MRILIIRHGDPDYEKDSLTQKGWHEAELLADKMEKTDVTAFYVSPLGRHCKRYT
jgi:broad specificity phosphatase PhoE